MLGLERWQGCPGKGNTARGTELENLGARCSLVKAHRFGAAHRSLIKIRGLLLSRWVPGSVHWHQGMGWTGIGGEEKPRQRDQGESTLPQGLEDPGSLHLVFGFIYGIRFLTSTMGSCDAYSRTLVFVRTSTPK